MLQPAGTIAGIDARYLYDASLVVFWGFEWFVGPRMKAGSKDRVQDGDSSLWLYIAFPLAWLGAYALLCVRGAAFGTPLIFRVGLVLMVLGQLLRWWSMATLGRLFTINVAIRPGHRLVESGPYRFVRHPSYSGILLFHVGVALCLGNALSGAALLIPVAVGIGHRIRVEEDVLHGAFDSAYREYMTRTKRLVPGLY